jgi:uncharacterized protein YciI
MKIFIVELTYIVPLETLEPLLAGHRQFLQAGYDSKRLLLSGPQNPRTGGIVVARSESIEEIQRTFAADPFFSKNAATYRFVEFTPTKFAPCLADWMT